GPGGEQLLDHHVGRSLRTPHAELAVLDRTDRGIRAKRHLDQAFEIRGDIDTAGLAVHARGQVLETGRRCLSPATEWTEKIPSQVKHARTRRRQAELEHS